MDGAAPLKPEYSIEVCSLCGELLENDSEYGHMPLAECPERCGHDDQPGGPVRRFRGEPVAVRVKPA